MPNGNPQGLTWPIPRYVQPGGPQQGFFTPGRETPICPFDGSVTSVVGAGDFYFVCSQCQRQFRQNGDVLGSVPAQTPFVAAPNVRQDRG